MHCANLVHILGTGFLISIHVDGNLIGELQSLYLRFGNLLNPISSGFGKTFESSSRFLIIFQF